MSETEVGNQVMPSRAVEAANRALCQEFGFTEGAAFMARVALEAAAPYLLAGAWDEGYEKGTLSQFEEPRNPYRPTP